MTGDNQEDGQVTSQVNKDLWLPWLKLWNGDLSVADEIIAPSFVAHFAPAGSSPGEVRGPEGLKGWIGGAMAAFTDHSFTTTVGPLADDDKVAGRWVFRGTYRGGIPGSSPTAVGKQVEYAGIDIFRVEGGKLVEYWLCADILQMLQQIGVIPS
jgi:predicted ester cyclase